MASRRLLKKIINAEIAEVIDFCYDIIADSPNKERQLNEVIDEAVELYDELIGAINEYKSAKNKQTYFAAIENKLSKEVELLNSKVVDI